jgi:hypothetical protein
LVAALTWLRWGLACAAGSPAAQVVIVDDELRVRRDDRQSALAAGQVLPLSDGQVTLTALRGETVAFQVIVFNQGALPGPASIAVTPFADPTGPRVELWRQHFVTVKERSRNERWPNESLGWSSGARPSDAAMTGEVPDALIPLTVDDRSRPSSTWEAFWVDLFVPEAATPGPHATTASVTVGGAPSARFTLTVDVKPAVLPYRAVSAFAFYEPARLEQRIGGGPAAERQLWQLLHAHHVDALAPLTAVADVERLADVFSGALFSPEHGYAGPGVRQPPAVVALGAYGQLGEPTPATVATVRAMVDRLAHLGTADLFLYAVDEDCASPRAADWKKALGAVALALPLAVGQTCAQPPAQQAADVALIPGPSFTRDVVGAARAAGRRAWIYNGALPRTGTLLLDAPPRGLLVNGWIAALTDIDRWFYWESTFWNDDNQGGGGAVDPFVNPATFHNRDGDTALGDGLLLYPGRQRAPFAGDSFGFAGVFPSLRLKLIRRGIEDAGYLILAAREQPDQAARIAAQAVPALLDEAAVDQPASWDTATDDGRPRFARARAALGALITRGDPLTVEQRAGIVGRLAQQRRAEVPTALTRRQRWIRTGTRGAALVVALIAFALMVGRARRRRARA